MSAGIYKYTNKINGKVYIGQSLNIEKRYEQHLYFANNINKLLAKGQKPIAIDEAINKYGIDNFSFEIIERIPAEKTDILDDREIYWIDYYNSYEDGYNNTIGGKSVRGENHPRAILTEKEVWDIREQYKNGVIRRKVFKPYIEKGITERSLLKVWNNETWCNVHQDVYTTETKMLHKNQLGHSEDQIGLNSLDRSIKQNEIDLWIKDYQNGMTINAIAKKYNRDNGTVEKYINNPNAISKVKYSGRVVKNIETGQIFKSINKAAKWAGCGATTLTRHLVRDKIAGKVPGTLQPAHWEELQ